MQDLIDRQAAIDALIRKMEPHNNGDGTITICMMSEGLVRETLNDLPSAQPVITCDGCKFVNAYDTDFPCCNCIRREKDYYAQE